MSAKKTTTAAEKTACRVYCGPTVRGVARRDTVYHGELPEALRSFMTEHPEVNGLVAPVERFAEVRRRTETPGTAEAILYRKIKSEMK